MLLRRALSYRNVRRQFGRLYQRNDTYSNQINRSLHRGGTSWGVRTIFGFGSSSEKNAEGSNGDILFAYLRQLKERNNVGSDDLLLEILSASSLKNVDKTLMERMDQIGAAAPKTETDSPKPTPAPAAAAPTQQPGLTLDQAIRTEQEVLERLKSAQARMSLLAIKTMGMSLGLRWQQMTGIIFGTQVQAITPLGFSADQNGILAYTNHCTALVNDPENQNLRDAVGAKWDFAMEVAFGVTEKRPMTREVARQFTEDMFQRMTDPAFLDRIDKVFDDLGDMSNVSTEDTETVMKVQAALFPLVFEIQVAVSEKHGYGGDDGYVMGQRALMEHANDEKVFEATGRMYQKLFERFGNRKP